MNNDCAIQITFSNSMLLQILQDLLHGHICKNMQDHKILLSIGLNTENTYVSFLVGLVFKSSVCMCSKGLCGHVETIAGQQ